MRASPEEVLAYMWDATKRSGQYEDDLEKSVVQQASGHSMLVYTKKKTPRAISDRDFLGRVLWKRTNEGFLFVTSPEESDARPITDSVVRAKYPSSMYLIHPDFGGSGGFAYLMNFYTASNLSYVSEIEEYFQELRGLEEWDADDGRAVGEAMCIKSKAEKHCEEGESKVGARMRKLFKKQKALKQIAKKYDFFPSLITRVVENKLRLAGVVNTPLCDVSEKEGRAMGAALAISIVSNLTAEAGVDDWVLKYSRSLGQLDREEPWFR